MPTIADTARRAQPSQSARRVVRALRTTSRRLVLLAALTSMVCMLILANAPGSLAHLLAAILSQMAPHTHIVCGGITLPC